MSHVFLGRPYSVSAFAAAAARFEERAARVTRIEATLDAAETTLRVALGRLQQAEQGLGRSISNAWDHDKQQAALP